MAERASGYEYLNSLRRFRFTMSTKHKLFPKKTFLQEVDIDAHILLCLFFCRFLYFLYVSKVFICVWRSQLNQEFSGILQYFNCISLLLLLCLLSSILYKRELDGNRYCFKLPYRNVDTGVCEIEMYTILLL